MYSVLRLQYIYSVLVLITIRYLEYFRVTLPVGCLGSGSDAKSLARACIGRPLEPAGTGRPRWLWRLAGSSCAEMLPITAAEAGKALGPMLPASAREHWPSCVLHAMLSPVHDCVAAKMRNELFLLQAIGGGSDW